MCLWLAWPTPPALPRAASPFPRIECTQHPPQHAGAQARQGRNLQNLVCIKPKNQGGRGSGNRDAFHGPRGIFSHRDAWPVLEQFLMYCCLSRGTAPILSPARLGTPSQWGEGCQDPRVGPGGAGCAHGELTPRLATGHPPWAHPLPIPKDPGRTDSAPVTLECQVGELITWDFYTQV